MQIMNPETRLILLRLGNAEELQGSQRWYEQGTAIASTVSQAMDANNFAEADTRLRVVHGKHLDVVMVSHCIIHCY